MTIETMRANRRDVAVAIQKTMKVSPQAGSQLKSPLRYLFAHDSSEFWPEMEESERQMANAIRPYKADRDRKFSDEIIMDLFNTKSESTDIMKTRIIIGKSGGGKSVYVGKTVGRIIEELDKSGSEVKIIFSQLRDVKDATDLWDAVIGGLLDKDLKNQRCGIKDFCNKLNISKTNKGLIFIDSLDELSLGSDNLSSNFKEVSDELMDGGLYPIWACREFDYKSKKINSIIDRYDEFVCEITPNIKFTSHIKEEMKENYNDDIVHWIENCYRTSPLLFTFDTNFEIPLDMRERCRNELDLTLIKRLEKCIEGNEFSEIEDLTKNIDYRKLSDFTPLVLHDCLVEFMFSLLVHEKLVSKEEINKFIDDIGCWLLNNLNNQVNYIDERIPSYISNNHNKLCLALRDLGLLKEMSLSQNNNFRFSHRTYAEYIVIKHIGEKLSDNKKILDQLLFRWRYPNDKDVDSLEEFHRRTGTFLCIIEPMKSQIPKTRHQDILVEPWNSAYTSWKADERRIEVSLEKKQLTGEQISALINSRSRPMMLAGFPGCGKTFTGVEYMIGQLVHSSDDKGLIVTLNKSLSKNIGQDISSMHSNSILLKGSFEYIEERITIEDTLGFLQNWAPDFLNDCKGSDAWYIDTGTLDGLFCDMSVPGVSNEMKMHYWRRALNDFQNCMFNTNTGDIIGEDEYINISKIIGGKTSSEKREQKAVTKKWHELLKSVTKKKLTINQACIILRNRFIHYEVDAQNEEELENLIKNFPVRAPFTSKERTDKEIIENHHKLVSKKGIYDTILVDEIQDLPAQFAILMSFLCPTRSHASMGHKLMFVGDENQSIHEDDFGWEKFKRNLNEISKHILESKIIKREKWMYTSHHLTDFLLENQNDVSQLTENQRNLPDIVNIMEQSREWPRGHVVDDWKMVAQRKQRKKVDIVNILKTKNWEDWEKKVKDIMNIMGSEANISLLISEKGVYKYITELKENNEVKATEKFDIWEMKGLERPSIVVIGGWIVSEKGEFKDIFNDVKRGRAVKKGIQVKDINEKQRDLMNSRMLVALSRATEKMLVLLAPTETISDSQGLNRKEYRFIQMEEPAFDEKYIKNNIDNEGIKLLLQPPEYDPLAVSIAALHEGMLLKKRKENNQLKDQWNSYNERIDNILQHDLPNSILREFLEKIDSNLDNDDDSLKNNILVNKLLDREVKNYDQVSLSNNIYRDLATINKEQPIIAQTKLCWGIAQYIKRLKGKNEHFDSDDLSAIKEGGSEEKKVALKKYTSVIIDEINIQLKEKMRVFNIVEKDTPLNFILHYFESDKYDSPWTAGGERTMRPESEIGFCLQELTKNDKWAELNSNGIANIGRLLTHIRVSVKLDNYVIDHVILHEFLDSLSNSTDPNILIETFYLYSNIPKAQIPIKLFKNLISKEQNDMNYDDFKIIINGDQGRKLIIDYIQDERNELPKEFKKLPDKYQILLLEKFQEKTGNVDSIKYAENITVLMIENMVESWLGKGDYIPKFEHWKISWNRDTQPTIKENNIELMKKLLFHSQMLSNNRIARAADVLRNPGISSFEIDGDKERRVPIIQSTLNLISIMKSAENIYKKDDKFLKNFLYDKDDKKLKKQNEIFIEKLSNDDVKPLLDDNIIAINNLIKNGAEETEELWSIKEGVFKPLIHRLSASLWLIDKFGLQTIYDDEFQNINKQYPDLPWSYNGDICEYSLIDTTDANVLQYELYNIEERPQFMKERGFWDSADPEFAPLIIPRKDWLEIRFKWHDEGEINTATLANDESEVKQIISDIFKIVWAAVEENKRRRQASINLTSIWKRVLDRYESKIRKDLKNNENPYDDNSWVDEDWANKKWKVIREHRQYPFKINIIPISTGGLKPATKDLATPGFFNYLIGRFGFKIDNNKKIIFRYQEWEEINEKYNKYVSD